MAMSSKEVEKVSVKKVKTAIKSALDPEVMAANVVGTLRSVAKALASGEIPRELAREVEKVNTQIDETIKAAYDKMGREERILNTLEEIGLLFADLSTAIDPPEPKLATKRPVRGRGRR